MQNNNLKNQNQLPSQVVAEIKFPFNPDMPSALSKERINELNQLSLRAFLNKRTSGIPDYNIMNDLIIETCFIKDLAEQIGDINMCGKFYTHIDKAFEMLLTDKNSITKDVFNTYQTLTSLFRLIEGNKDLMNDKWVEAERILNDIDVLDREDIDRGKTEGVQNV